jgi:hypothetical protein
MQILFLSTKHYETTIARRTLLLPCENWHCCLVKDISYSDACMLIPVLPTKQYKIPQQELNALLSVVYPLLVNFGGTVW